MDTAIELFFEDFVPGRRWDLGERVLAREEVIAFAREWDPQSFHVDEALARGGPFGGLIASGWHTVVVAMRLYVDALLVRSASLGSPGVDELRWLKPVRPGVPLRVRAVVEEATPSRSRADRGSVVVRLEVEDDQHDTVMTMKGRGIFGRRGSAVPS